VTLLQVSSTVAALPGVVDASLVMGTDLNRAVLEDSGLLVDEAVSAGPNDLVVAVRAEDATAADAALKRADALLAERRQTHAGPTLEPAPRSLRSAHHRLPAANLALISVPGAYAAAEAWQALSEGLHVLLFSDNVPLQDEIALKQRGRELGLLVMGPDCGTSILGGIGLGFANSVRRGRIGLIGASGTGLQEVTTLLHQAGEGISHALGTGGRDLDTQVGAMTTLQALELLAADAETDVIVLISKPPAPEVAERVLAAAAQSRKRVIACLLGFDPLSLTLSPLGEREKTPSPRPSRRGRGETPSPRLVERFSPDPGVRGAIQFARNLYQAARLAASPHADWEGMELGELPRPRLAVGQDRALGLYCGGTLCEEAALVLTDSRHASIDFGDDRYTRGRAHPMIDPTLRNHAIVEAGANPSIAVLLLDVILGYGAHTDPAAVLAPVVEQAIARAAQDGRVLSVFGHVVGTDWDAQNLARQQTRLRAAGMHLFGSNYHAAVAASLLVEGLEDPVRGSTGSPRTGNAHGSTSSP
jgi:succinyl-CoA synthetase alpha subunit